MARAELTEAVGTVGPATQAWVPEADPSEDAAGTAIFDALESSVRTYCRRFPVVFDRAEGHVLWSEYGAPYVDFLSGAGVLNYGHNHPAIKQRLIEYLLSDRVVHSLDLHTSAKRAFLSALRRSILGPRGLTYRVQFTGPTGTNAVEAALKIARRATGRPSIVAFTHGFHGLSLGALAASATAFKRAAAGVPLTHVTRLPYDGFLGENVDTIPYIEAFLDDPGSGVDWPAAFLLETVQGEGGLLAASPTWLRRLEDLARRRGILVIVDDIQAGCGRTGTFFSFEPAGLEPDIVCLSKSISGIGLPMALVLVRPEFDRLRPGEDSGTFRGNNLAFVGASAALSLWEDPAFEPAINCRTVAFDRRLRAIADRFAAAGCRPRGRGFLRGLAFTDPGMAPHVSRAAFKRGLLCETSGASSEVLKLMPPIVIDEAALQEGLDLLEDAIDACMATT